MGPCNLYHLCTCDDITLLLWTHGNGRKTKRYTLIVYLNEETKYQTHTYTGWDRGTYPIYVHVTTLHYVPRLAVPRNVREIMYC